MVVVVDVAASVASVDSLEEVASWVDEMVSESAAVGVGEALDHGAWCPGFRVGTDGANRTGTIRRQWLSSRMERHRLQYSPMSTATAPGRMGPPGWSTVFARGEQAVVKQQSLRITHF